MTFASDWRFDAIGTAWSITTPEPLTPAVCAAVRARIDEYDRVFSRFRADSAVSVLARSGGTADLGPDAVSMFELYDRVGIITSGAVTPLIGESLDVLGYDAAYSMVPVSPPEAAPDPVILRLDGSTASLQRPASIDVGAAGKGQLVDIVAGILVDAGIGEAIVDASGDLRCLGETPVDVALEHPYDSSRGIGVARLIAPHRSAIAGSGVNRRSWSDGLHHVLDGRTGQPVDTIVATWALAQTALVADIVATALFFVHGSALQDDFDVDWVRVYSDGRYEASSAVAGGMFA